MPYQCRIIVDMDKAPAEPPRFPARGERARGTGSLEPCLGWLADWQAGWDTGRLQGGEDNLGMGQSAQRGQYQRQQPCPVARRC